MMDTNKRIAIEWIYPGIWGVLMFNILRAITDLARHGVFWEGEIWFHLLALVLSILICYVADIVWRRRLYKTEAGNNIATEYLYIFAELFVSINLLLAAGQVCGILFMGAGWIDYMLINVTYLPLLLIFYTLIRNGIISRDIQSKMLILEKLKAEKKEAELDFLKSQYHPHFLFNALNTIYFQIEENNEQARKTIELLSELLRYQLYDVNQTVLFSQEIQYLRSYIAFQQLRKSDKLIVKTAIDAALQEQKIHPLLFQPLVENAFKYVGGQYQIDLLIELRADKVHFILKNSISDLPISADIKNSGIGLSSLKRRLELLYHGKHQLITNIENGSFKAELILQIE